MVKFDYTVEQEEETIEELEFILREMEAEVRLIRLRIATIRKDNADREYLSAIEGVIFG